MENDVYVFQRAMDAIIHQWVTANTGGELRPYDNLPWSAPLTGPSPASESERFNSIRNKIFSDALAMIGRMVVEKEKPAHKVARPPQFSAGAIPDACLQLPDAACFMKGR